MRMITNGLLGLRVEQIEINAHIAHNSHLRGLYLYNLLGFNNFQPGLSAQKGCLSQTTQYCHET